jgi:acetolactate synthase-1/2/3 large subunit
MATCGEVLVEILQNYGIDTIFGIPGVHTVELYRGLNRTNIRHVTATPELLVRLQLVLLSVALA